MGKQATAPTVARLTGRTCEIEDLPPDLPIRSAVGPDEIAIILPYAPMGLNSHGGLIRTNRWSAKEIKEAWRAVVHDCIESAAIERYYLQNRWLFSKQRPAKQIVVQISTSVGRDWDNFGAALKYLQDALVFYGFMQDDSTRVVPRVEWFQVHARSQPEERFILWLVDADRDIWQPTRTRERLTVVSQIDPALHAIIHPPRPKRKGEEDDAPPKPRRSASKKNRATIVDGQPAEEGGDSHDAQTASRAQEVPGDTTGRPGTIQRGVRSRAKSAAPRARTARPNDPEVQA